MSFIDKNMDELRAEIFDLKGNERRYKVVDSFVGTSAESKSMVSGFLRRFQPIKKERLRKTNVECGFNFQTDSLMDYPSIIQAKMGGNQESYNMLISVHIPICPYYCWHCYNNKKLHLSTSASYHTAKEIVAAFIDQRRYDGSNKEKPVYSNVLRITGGEPFLVPELILECLQELEKAGLSKEVFLWTETDLWPFVRVNGKSFVENLIVKTPEGQVPILKALSKYPNFAVHPCLHGLDDENIAEITQRKGLKISELLEALKTLVESGIDIYPTFGSNVSSPTDLPIIFKELLKINPFLPLRVALVQYDSDYPDVEKRLTEEQKDRKCTLYSKYTNLRIWNYLLLKHYGIGYAVIPRNLIQLNSSSNLIKSPQNFINSDYSPKQELLYIFKSSFREDYHRELLDILSLPLGHYFKFEYDKNWVQIDLLQHMKMRPDDYKGKNALLFYINLDSQEKTTIPLRKLIIRSVQVEGRVLALTVELGGFMQKKEPNTSLEEKDSNIDLRLKLEELFGDNALPGTPSNKYVLLGEEIQELEEFRPSETFSAWVEAVNSLHEKKCSKFQKSLFFRVTVRDATQRLENNSTMYDVDAGERFSVEVEYYLPNYSNFPADPESREIIFEVSSETIKAIGPNQFVISKYGSNKLTFCTEEFQGERICFIHFHSLKTPFEAPMIDIPIRVKGVGNKIAAASLTLSALGGGLVTTSLPILFSKNPNLGWGLEFIPGAILLGVGGYFAAKGKFL